MRKESVRAALVLDVPTLSRSGGAGDAFLQAINAPPWNTQNWRDDEPLWLAAHALILAQSGEPATAVERLEQISGTLEETLLTHALIALIADREQASSALERAVELAADLDEAEFGARVYLKIAALARDADANKLVFTALQRCLELAPSGTRLRATAIRTAAEFGLVPLEDIVNLPAGSYDPLLSAPWIEAEALRAAADIAADRMRVDLQTAWSSTVHLGTTPVQRLASLELQCSWVGRHDTRDLVRKQLGAALLTRYADHPNDWTYGLWTWVAGGGRNVGNAARAAEPHIAGHQVIEILDALLETPGRHEQALEFTKSLWHRVPDDQIERVIDAFPVGNDVWDPQGCAFIWASLLPRAPAAILSRLSLLPVSSVDLVVEQIGPAALQRLSLAETDRLLSLLDSRDHSSSASTTGLRIALIAQLSGPEAAGLAAAEVFHQAHGPRQTLAVFTYAPTILRDREHDALYKELGEYATRAALDATRGKVDLVQGDVYVDLARVALVGGYRTDAIERLLTVAEAPDSAGQQRLSAYSGLTLLAPLESAAAQRLRGATTEPAVARFIDTALTSDVLRAAKLTALAPDLTGEERLFLLGGVRATEPRMRQLCITALSRTEEVETAPEDVEWSLVGGLFDPVGDVVLAALRGVSAGLRHTAPRAVATDRIVRLFDERPAAIRAAAVRVAKAWSEQGATEALGGILARADDDPSYLVRIAR